MGLQGGAKASSPGRKEAPEHTTRDGSGLRNKKSCLQ